MCRFFHADYKLNAYFIVNDSAYSPYALDKIIVFLQKLMVVELVKNLPFPCSSRCSQKPANFSLS